MMALQSRLLRFRWIVVVFWCAVIGTDLPSLSGQERREPSEKGQADEGTRASKVTDNKDTAWVARANRILEIAGEEPDSEAEKSRALKELKSLKPKSDDDARYVYAFILASMNEKKWQFAHDLSVDLLKRNKDYIPARVASARSLLMLDKRLLPAIAELEALARTLDSPSENVSPEQLECAASFLGLAVGYLEGPCREMVKATILSDLLATTEGLPAELKGPFSIARETIQNEFRTVMTKGEDGLKKMRSDVEKDSEKSRANLEKQRKEASEKKEVTRKRLEDSWAKVKGSWDAAWTRSQYLSKNAASLQIQLDQLLAEVALLRAPAPDNKGNVNQTEQRQYVVTKTQLEQSVTNLSVQLNQIAIEYNNMIREGIVLENQMASIRSEAQREGLNFEMQNESFAKMEAIVKGKEKKAGKAATTKLSKSTLVHARSFDTYDNFNFFKEQSLLIETLPKE